MNTIGDPRYRGIYINTKNTLPVMTSDPAGPKSRTLHSDGLQTVHGPHEHTGYGTMVEYAVSWRCSPILPV